MSYRLTTLTNGVKVLTVPQPEALSVSIMIIANAGAKDEGGENSGISHFLEHMGFKGTAQRPDSFTLSSEIDSLGANYNAFTGHDATAYYLTVIPDKIAQAVDILADMYLNSIFPSEEVEKEKGVIIEEIKMYEDEPRLHVWDVFSKLAYEGSVAGRLIIGERETVSAITQKDLINYRNKHYIANETIIVVTGNFVEEQLTQLIESKFSKLNKGSVGPYQKIILTQDGPKYSLVNRPIDQSHFVLGFKSVDLVSDQYYPLVLLSRVLGGGTSSRLFQNVREKLGAAYYVGASQSSHLDHGYFSIYAGVDAKRLAEVLLVVGQEIKKIKDELIGGEELTRVKDYLIGNLFLGLETPSDQTYFYGEQVLVNKEILSPKQYAEKIRAITAEELRDLAQEFFQKNQLNLAVVGPDYPLAEIIAKLEV